MKPEMMTPKISEPITVPMIEPRPPDSETPPMTAMAIASSSYITPMPDWAVRFLEPQHHGGERGKHAGDDVDEDLVVGDLDAGHARGVLVGTDRITVLAIPGVGHDQLEQHGQRQEDDDGHPALPIAAKLSVETR